MSELLADEIRVLVAVNDSGAGWVMGWDASRALSDDCGLSTYDAFREDVFCCGRDTRDLGIDHHPEAPGVWLFNGKILWLEEGVALYGPWMMVWPHSNVDPDSRARAWAMEALLSGSASHEPERAPR
jgi:hypothetical protein